MHLFFSHTPSQADALPAVAVFLLVSIVFPSPYLSINTSLHSF